MPTQGSELITVLRYSPNSGVGPERIEIGVETEDFLEALNSELIDPLRLPENYRAIFDSNDFRGGGEDLSFEDKIENPMLMLRNCLVLKRNEAGDYISVPENAETAMETVMKRHQNEWLLRIRSNFGM